MLSVRWNDCENPTLAPALQFLPQIGRALTGDRMVPHRREIKKRTDDERAQVQPRMWNDNLAKPRSGIRHFGKIARTPPAENDLVVSNKIEVQGARAPAGSPRAAGSMLDAMQDPQQGRRRQMSLDANQEVYIRILVAGTDSRRSIISRGSRHGHSM